MAKLSEFPVVLTDAAVTRVKKLLEKSGNAESFLRLGVKGGGCSGFEYVMRMDNILKESDLQTQYESAKVVCDPKSAPILQGSTLHYTGNLIGGGFEFQNPNAEKSCGCGSSFSLKPGFSAAKK